MTIKPRFIDINIQVYSESWDILCIFLVLFWFLFIISVSIISISLFGKLSQLNFCAENRRWKSNYLKERIWCLILGFIHAGPVCLRCTDVAEISECITNTAECGDNEVISKIHNLWSLTHVPVIS